MPEQYRPPVTPVEIEHRMIGLMRSNAEAYTALREAEAEYARLKTPRAVAMARARGEATAKARDDDMKWNEADREAFVLLKTEEIQVAWDMAELKVKSAKALVAQVANELELIRSLSASVRNSMQMGG